MALNDVSSSSWTDFFWYKDAYNSSLDSTYNVNSLVIDFKEDSGKANTIRMKTANDAGTYGTKNTRDLWQLWTSGGTVTSTNDSKTYEMVTKVSDSGKWFIPSKTEWTAFADYLFTTVGVNPTNYEDYGLVNWYWTSSQKNENNAWYTSFGYRDVYWYYVDMTYCVRLCATF